MQYEEIPRLSGIAFVMHNMIKYLYICNFCKVGIVLGTEQLYLVTLSLLTAGIFTVCIPKIQIKAVNVLAHGFAALASIAGVLCAFSVFLTGPWQGEFSISHPLGPFLMRVDGLAALFILALGIVGLAASIYAIGYGAHYYANRFRLMAGLFNAFLLSMYLVLSANQVFTFLIAWELMALVSFFLVAHDDEQAENTRAAFIYLIMTHVGTAFVAAAFFILASNSGSMDFRYLAGAPIDSQTKSLVFLFTIVGFGTKAGIVPLHIWLPRAHPVAPTHVSALMSGIMIKTALYGMARFYLDFLGTGPAWWGIIVLIIAALSAVLGVLYALMENDIKRVLAYSSVENIGLMLLSVGTGLFFSAKGKPALAAFAWTAALYHMVGHAVFKSLLFLAAGSVVHATGTKNMELLGGLIKVMPYTAAVFLAGAAAISALPPLSGFAGEWLIFQSLFLLPAAAPTIGTKLLASGFIAVFGLTGALAAACFVKAFGITFLAKPRSSCAEKAHEAPMTMWLPCGFLAVTSAIFGIWPQYLITLITTALNGRRAVDTRVFDAGSWHTAAFTFAEASGTISPAAILVLITIGAAAAVFLFRCTGSPRILAGETWTCGIIPDARMQYTGTGFSKPIRMAFRFILRPQREVLVNEGGGYHGRKLTYQLRIRYVINEMYHPVNKLIIQASSYIKRIQAGSVQLYVAYITVATVAVLIWNAWWSN